MGVQFGVTARTATGKEVCICCTEIEVPPTVRNGVSAVSSAVTSAGKSGVTAAKKGVTAAKKTIDSRTANARVTINSLTQVDLSKMSPDHTKQIVDKMKTTQHESMLPNAAGHGRVERGLVAFK